MRECAAIVEPKACTEHGHHGCIWCGTFPPPRRYTLAEHVEMLRRLPPRIRSTQEEIDARRAARREARNG